MKEQLLKDINKWLADHRNPYNGGIEESSYWTMLDLAFILQSSDDESVASICKNIFNRFRFYY